ncbi:MAG: bacteriocin-protection protein [Bacteroidota bacterium]|jgi:uncharacterized protein YdeI (YjbR/CyaY-like superfamily)|nr:bacteriocin-protection protein [Bacteroidota bacterium]
MNVPVFFKKGSDFRKWLDKNHLKKTELLVGFYKIGSGKPSMTWSESVDEALCYGWIDGIRRSIDKESYCIRFTPRKPKSIWSAVNINKMAILEKAGLLKPAGIAAFEKREESRSKVYAYEKAPAVLDPEFEKQFRKNKKAFAYFNSLSPSIQRVSVHWVMSAKQEKTRKSRMEALIRDSEAGRKIKPLSYN